MSGLVWVLEAGSGRVVERCDTIDEALEMLRVRAAIEPDGRRLYLGAQCAGYAIIDGVRFPCGLADEHKEREHICLQPEVYRADHADWPGPATLLKWAGR